MKYRYHLILLIFPSGFLLFTIRIFLIINHIRQLILIFWDRTIISLILEEIVLNSIKDLITHNLES